MAAFQDTREETETKVLVHLLTEIERNPALTQRSMADELGIALGLMNQYLKKCASKGWIRVTQISPRRITYFLTPEGMREKTSMVRDYLSRSMSFFRDAKSQCDVVFQECQSLGITTLALVGSGDLADIAELVSSSYPIKIQVVSCRDDLSPFDRVLITDVMEPQATFNAVAQRVSGDKILTLPLLHISRGAQ